MEYRVAEPKIDRDITVHMMGDWGVANLHRICGWLAAEMWKRAGAGSRFATWSGKGGVDAIEGVLSGQVQTSLFVPAGFAQTIFEGKGIYSHPDIGRLRAIASIPQDDRIVIAIDSKFGIKSLDDWRRLKPKLTVTVGYDNLENMTGYATHRLLEAAGMSRPEMEAWGTTFIEGEGPWDTIPLVTDGRADAVIFEAVMTPYWKELLDNRDMTFLPIADNLLTALEQRYGWERGTIPKDRFKGLSGPFETLDFSDFLLLCRDDLADDIAYLMAWCSCETKDVIEGQYKHLAIKDSPVTYPLEPKKLARTPIPLHPGAEAYYQNAGILAKAA